MTGLARLVLVVVVAYVFIGLVYPTGQTVYYELFTKNPDALPVPWTSVIAFLAWFRLPAVLWPWSLHLAATRRPAVRAA